MREQADDDIVCFRWGESWDDLACDDAEVDRWQPDQQNTDWVEDNGALKVCDLFSGHTHNRDVREHDRAERDEHIREELFGWHPLTGEEEALRAFADCLHGRREAANALCN